MSVTERLKIVFQQVQDPRIDRTKKHPLMSIIFVAICAAIAGIDEWVGMHDYCEANFDLFAKLVPLPNGVPSHDTFGRVMSRLDPKRFNECFMEFSKSLQRKCREVIAIDGKTARGSSDPDGAKGALHSVSAWATQNKLVLGQVVTDDKSNEITAVPLLLAMLDLENQIVTMDAMGCQRKTSAQIIKQKGDYVLGLKGNQGTLHEDIKLLFADWQASGWKDFHGTYHEENDKGHGRIECRRCWASSDLGSLVDTHKWPGFVSAVLVESGRTIKGKTTTEQRFYISSLEPNAEQLSQAIRAHWEVENKVHWVLDLTYNEDGSKIYKDNGPEIMNMARKLGLNLVNHARGKLSVRRMQNKAKMSAEYLFKLISQEN